MELDESQRKPTGGTALTSVARRFLNVLSLDGGGIRGLSALIILRRLMYTIRPATIHELVKPCEVFDMICGTSTGGLIAIMLGRLRMGIQEAIDVYLELAKSVFQERHRASMIPNMIGALAGIHRFSGEKLASAVQEIVQKCTKDRDALLLDSNPEQCRTFVVATLMANSEPVVLRSYQCDREDSAQCKIWQAARATSAAPTFFPSISFGKPPVNYADGAIGNNNPINLLMREVNSVWGSDAEHSCIVSIGTGHMSDVGFGSRGMPILLACTKLAMNAENAARAFKHGQGATFKQQGRYFRFNARGMAAVSLEEWHYFDKVAAATTKYLDECGDEIKACSDELLKRTYGAQVEDYSNARSISRERPTTPSTEYNDIGRIPSRYFTGRSDILESLRECLCLKNELSRVAVLIGLGGIGKTQISLKFFEKNRNLYPIAMFINCSTKEEVVAAFMKFAQLVVDEVLRRSPRTTLEEAEKKIGFAGLLDQRQAIGPAVMEAQMRVVDAVKRWLREQDRRALLIFDNANDPAGVELQKFVPRHRNIDVIVTSRDQGAEYFGKAFSIDEMSKDDAVQLLSVVSKRKSVLREKRQIAADICKTLGYLPLAIDQAGGYLAADPDMRIDEYLPRYSAYAKRLLSKVPHDGYSDYRHSAFTTWEMSFQRLLSLSPRSAALLQVLGFISNQDICTLLYNQYAEQNFGVMPMLDVSAEPSLPGDTQEYGDALQDMWKLCLIKRSSHTSQKSSFAIHPVVHVWIKERLSPEKRDFYARRALILVARALPSHRQADTDAWVILRRLYPHLLASWTSVRTYTGLNDNFDDAMMLEALEAVATTFRQEGNFDISEEVLIRAHIACECAHGPHALKTLGIGSKLASIYDVRGKLLESEQLYHQVYNGLKTVKGDFDRQTLAALHNLANILKYLERNVEAEKLYKAALEGRQRFGKEDPDTLETMDALASLYYAANRPQEAEPLRISVLEAREKTLGIENPETLGAVLDMGMLYSSEKPELTLRLFERAYEHRKVLLQSEQTVQTLNSLSMVAAFYANTGHMEKAEQIYTEVLERQQLVLGEKHLDTIWTQCCLGVLLFGKSRTKDAVEKVEKAFIDIKAKLGPDHLDSLWVAHALAVIYECWDKIDEAQKLQENVVKGYIRELGERHINTLYMITDLGDCYARANKPVEAEINFRKAYEGKQLSFGFRSAHSLFTAILLASTWRELGNAEDSEKLLKKVLKTSRDLLGEEHADTDLCMMHLADLYISQQRFTEARDLYQKIYATRLKLSGKDHSNTQHAKNLIDEVDQRIRFPNLAQAGSTATQENKSRIEPRYPSFRPRRVRSVRWCHAVEDMKWC